PETDLHDQKVRDAYANARAGDEPPAALDDAIRAAARRAVRSVPKSLWRPRLERWQVPLAVAATVVLSASLMLVIRTDYPDMLTSSSTQQLSMEQKRESTPMEARIVEPTPAMPIMAAPPQSLSPLPKRREEIATPNGDATAKGNLAATRDWGEPVATGGAPAYVPPPKLAIPPAESVRAEPSATLGKVQPETVLPSPPPAPANSSLQYYVPPPEVKVSPVPQASPPPPPKMAAAEVHQYAAAKTAPPAPAAAPATAAAPVAPAPVVANRTVVAANAAPVAPATSAIAARSDQAYGGVAADAAKAKTVGEVAALSKPQNPAAAASAKPATADKVEKIEVTGSRIVYSEAEIAEITSAWIARLEELRKQGKWKELRAEKERFLKAFPKVALPKDLQELPADDK
ncbi:MAG: hypothetical protein HY255_08050, partial [Betaproteobacteria bacterium]|nr:hypothetical protein [Betaproteobacteria bacterium]